MPAPRVDQSEWVSSQGSVSAAPYGAVHRPQLWEESLGKPQAVWTLFAHILHLEKSSIVTPPSLHGFFPRFQKSTWERWSLGCFCLFLPISPIIYPNSTSCERRRFIPISPILWVFQILKEIKVGVLFCFFNHDGLEAPNHQVKGTDMDSALSVVDTYYIHSKIIQVFFSECLMINMSLHNPHTSFLGHLHRESFSIGTWQVRKFGSAKQQKPRSWCKAETGYHTVDAIFSRRLWGN